MRYRGTFILLILVGALAAYLLIIELPARKAQLEQEGQADQLLHFDPAEVSFLDLAYPNREAEREIILEKAPGGEWQIVKPVRTAADPFRVEDLLLSLQAIKTARIVEENPLDIGAYGLDQPDVKISLKVGDREEQIYFGDESPVGSTVYAMRPEERHVRLLDRFYRSDVTLTVADLRQKEVLSFDPQDIVAVQIEYPGRLFALAREEGEWWISEPGRYKGDQSEIGDLLSSLSRLRASDFIDEDVAGTLKTLLSPRIKVELKSGQKDSIRLSIHAAKGQEKLYAHKNGQGPIYIIEPDAVDPLEKDLFGLRDKHLHAFDPSSVQLIEIKKKSRDPVRIRRQKDQWEIGDRALEKGQQDQVADLLHQLGELQADDPVRETPHTLDAFGFGDPRLRITLRDGAGNTLVDLMVGREKEGRYYARAGSSGEVYLISKDVVESITEDSELTAGAP